MPMRRRCDGCSTERSVYVAWKANQGTCWRCSTCITSQCWQLSTPADDAAWIEWEEQEQAKAGEDKGKGDSRPSTLRSELQTFRAEYEKMMACNGAVLLKVIEQGRAEWRSAWQNQLQQQQILLTQELFLSQPTKTNNETNRQTHKQTNKQTNKQVTQRQANMPSYQPTNQATNRLLNNNKQTN